MTVESTDASASFPPRYEPIDCLGRGGGGEVWSARDRLTGEVVALKALAPDADEREVMALVREAAALSGVEGLGVPRVLRFGRLDQTNRPFLVRELVEGCSLLDHLHAAEDVEGVMTGLAAVAQAADQLSRLHRALLLHGDIKPANIIVRPDGIASLVDLGLAATWREGGAKAEGLTPKYAAPELLHGHALTVRGEVYALGATLAEVAQAGEDVLSPDVFAALRTVVEHATAEVPDARFPSAEEMASALRSAARLTPREPVTAGAAVWPIVGLDGPSGRLLKHVSSLRRGGGLVVTGPPLSGRSALLRRLAWSLGAGGYRVAWLDADAARQGVDALRLELAAHEGHDDVVVLVDDADQLDALVLDELNARRETGARLVLVAGVDGPGTALPGRTFEVFPVPRLSDELAGELIRRAVPSLSDAVVRHVVAQARGWPGHLRRVVSRLAGHPVVSPDDVDRLLTSDDLPHSVVRPSASPLVNSSLVRSPDTGLSSQTTELERLLDRGHFEEAAELLETMKEDSSPAVAIARARLLTNRGDAGAALAELTRVMVAVRANDVGLDVWLAWHLHAARAHLRGGGYARAEATALAAADRFTEVERTEPERLSVRERLIAAEAMAVCGLARSFASEHDRAREILDASVSVARTIGEPRLLSVTLGSLAFALQRNDQLDAAKAAYEEGLAAAEKAGDAGTVATTRLNLAGIAKNQGNLSQAIEHLEAAVDMGRRSGRMATLRQALLNLANLDMYLGRLAKARASLDQLASVRDELPPQFVAQLLALEAESASLSGEWERAVARCDECAAAYETMGRTLDAAEAGIEGVLFATHIADARADELVERLARIEQQLGDAGAHRALLALARGRVETLKERNEAALRWLDEALDIARSGRQRDLMWRALEVRADVRWELGQTMSSKRDREEALALLEEIASRLPRDLREVFWNDPRRRALRSEHHRDLSIGKTLNAKAPIAAGFPPTGTRTAMVSDRLARVLEINREIAGTYELPRLLERVTDHAIALMGAERGFVILKSRRPGGEAITGGSSDLSIHASRDQQGDDPHARFSQSIADKVINSGDPVLTLSARDDDQMADYVSVHQLMLQSVACVPIRSRSAGVIGALYVETRLAPGAGFQEELVTLSALADQVGIAISTARLIEEIERKAKELEATNSKLASANEELEQARQKLENSLESRTAQLQATRRDLRDTRAVLRGHFGYQGLVGTSDAMRRVYALVDRVRDADVPVLISGESGTGKERVARAIHQSGQRGKKAFLGINCGAIPEHLLESELFGHVRGAFTGADRDRKGLFREATGGTLLLDEIGEMPPKMQATLLRVLQERVVRPVGGTKEEPIDTRVIAATHRDLASMVADGSFREDLFYRLNVIPVRVPPLRERVDDIPVLIDHFLGIFAARYQRDRRSVSRPALKLLMGYGWPGNVRQLENVLLNAWVLSDHPELEPDDFELPQTPSARQPRANVPPPTAAAPHADAGKPVEASLSDHKANEKERILEALSSCNWNRVKAAELCGMPRRTFYRRLKEYGIQ